MAGVSILFISGSEIFIILLVVLLLFGANKLPEIARGLGKGMNEFRRATRDIRTEFDEQTKDIQKDVKEMKKDIEDQTRFNLNDSLFDDDGGRRDEKADEGDHTPGDQQFQEKTRTPEDQKDEDTASETLDKEGVHEDYDPSDPYGLNKEKGGESETEQDRKDESRADDSRTSGNENTTSGQ